MPVPRRFDRRPPERDSTRINERIRVPEVRVIGEDGTQIGVMRTDEALRYAQERDLDLVEVAPEARPPVCRVLDYSKYKYEQSQKQKAARKHQQQITIREIKFRPKIAQNDYDGDGKCDLGVWRDPTGDFWYRSSINGAFISTHWGAPNDMPIAGYDTH